jgi:hypothetical protein
VCVCMCVRVDVGVGVGAAGKVRGHLVHGQFARVADVMVKLFLCGVLRCGL